jgi:hypothetical protein
MALLEPAARNRVDRMRRRSLQKDAPESSVLHRNQHMAPAHMNGATEIPGSDAFEEMAKYGIKRVSIEYFYFGSYGYLDLKDAIAQAKRETPPDRVVRSSFSR